MKGIIHILNPQPEQQSSWHFGTREAFNKTMDFVREHYPNSKIEITFKSNA